MVRVFGRSAAYLTTPNKNPGTSAGVLKNREATRLLRAGIAHAVAAEIGLAVGIVRAIALHAIADSLLPLLLGGARRDRAADDGRADADADRRADTDPAASAPATTAPAAAAASTTALGMRRRDARGNEGAGRGNHADGVHDDQRAGREHARHALAYGVARSLSSHIVTFLFISDEARPRTDWATA
jgi:hypothetical protein